MPGLQRETRRRLVAALEQVPTLSTTAGRDLLLLDWPPALRASLTITNTLAVDLNDIIFKALSWPVAGDESPPLALLVENAQDLVRGSALETVLRDLLSLIRQELAPVPAGVASPSAPEATPPVPEAERAARFAALVAAFGGHDYAQVLVLAQGLPPTYPGLAPLRARAKAAQEAAEAAANALAEVFANGDWAGVLDRAAQLAVQGITILPQAQVIIDLARQNVPAGQEPSIPPPA